MLVTNFPFSIFPLVKILINMTSHLCHPYFNAKVDLIPIYTHECINFVRGCYCYFYNEKNQHFILLRPMYTYGCASTHNFIS